MQCIIYVILKSMIFILSFHCLNFVNLLRMLKRYKKIEGEKRAQKKPSKLKKIEGALKIKQKWGNKKAYKELIKLCVFL